MMNLVIFSSNCQCKIFRNGCERLQCLILEFYFNSAGTDHISSIRRISVALRMNRELRE